MVTPEERTSRTLAQLDEDFAGKVRQVLDAMRAIGRPMVAYDGKRTAAQQQALFAKGRTAPGAIVTHLDGVTKHSYHQSGKAVDCAFLVSGAPWSLSWDGSPAGWEVYMACGEALGLTAGGRWRMRDYPHLEQR